MIGNNELGPRNSIEIFVGATILLLSSILNASIFSEMAIMLYILTKKEAQYQLRLDLCNHIMASINLPTGYQDDIRDFVQKT